MSQLLKSLRSFFILFIFPVTALCQDTLYTWNISSQKIDEGRYELIFSASAQEKGWQLYAPNQVINGVKMYDLQFNDSSIIVEGVLRENGKVKTIQSPIFDTSVSVHEDEAEWRGIIKINGPVPAQLQGQLGYYYGRNDTFNTASHSFTVSLEGGIASS